MPAMADPSGDRSFLRCARWNPYLVGIGIGVLSWVVFVVVDSPLGMSTAVSSAAGAAVDPFVDIDANLYWQRYAPSWNYGMLFLVGTFLGALISSLVSRSFHLETVPQVWQDRYGSATWKRMVGALIGGALALYGARMAGGCTSGHGISGTLQLALSSWVFFIVMFISGVAAAALMFGLRGSQAAAGGGK